MRDAFSRSSPSSSSGSAERLTAKIQPAIEALSSSHPSSLPAAVDAAENLLILRHSFIDDAQPREVRDAFRQLRGFQVLVSFLQALSDLYTPEALAAEDRKSLFGIVTDIHGVLAEALRDHNANKRYFASHVLGDGAPSLEEVLSAFTSKFCWDTNQDCCVDSEQFYGGLLAAGLGQGAVSDLFSTLRKKFDNVKEPVVPAAVRDAVGELLGTTETVENAEFFGPFVRMWLEQSHNTSRFLIQRIAVPACLARLAQHSQRNCVALHSTGMLTEFLGLVVEATRPESEIGIYTDLASSLCCNGINTLSDAATLFRSAHNNPRIGKFLLNAIQLSEQPAFIQFDLSRNGYSSAELATLGKSFPPTSSSGYTLALWARFDNFDPAAHTTIFGVFDATQTCFLLAYLEKDTRNFILQTSINGARPSVRFKSTVFEPGQWYHICIVHKRPRVGSSSRALLFIDGEFVEQLKAEYPLSPTTPPTQKPSQIQAFLGTPHELAAKIGRNVSTSQWSSASTVLFSEAFNDDIVAVISQLGPRYHGNFQDCLGSFQTYRASASLNLRNESLHPGKEESSDILAVIRQKASLLIPEATVLLNISPMNVLDDDDRNHVDESQLVKSLSKQAAKNLNRYTKRGNSVVINGAVPAINDALTRPHGVAVLVGDPVVSVPQSLDDASWRVGGCPAVHLSMIEAADTAESLRVSVEIMFNSVEHSWRNSESMEKENGYGILAVLLREKLGFPSFQASSSKTSAVCSTPKERNDLAMELLMLILKFVGYDFADPNKSIIVNPMAYRILLVDLEIWALGELPLLEVYYSQFRTLCVECHHRRFNARRLSRMRVIKKLLETLRSGSFTEESLTLFTAAFKSLVTCSLTAEVLRSVALFVTDSTHQIKEPSSLQKKKSMRFERRPRRTIGQQFPDANVTYLSKRRIGVGIFKAYADILCTDNDALTIKKFARTVTNKWLLYLISGDDPEVVTLATKILARLLVIHGSSYVRKFADKSGGFVVLRHRLKRWWHLRALWPICFGILFGQDVAPMNIDNPPVGNKFLELFAPVDRVKIVLPEIVPVIVGMFQSGLKSVLSSLPLHAGSTLPFGDRSELPKSESSSSVWSVESRSLTSEIDLLNSVSFVLAECQTKSQNFRDFAASPSYSEELLSMLFPIIVGSDTVNANLELDSQFSGLTVGSDNVVIQPLSSTREVLHTTTVEQSEPQVPERPLRRASSFILVSSERAKYAPSSARLRHVVEPKNDATRAAPGHFMVQKVLDLVLAVFTDQLLSRKDFTGFSLFIKTPPGFIEHQTFFESWLLRNILSHVEKEISSNQRVLLEPRVINNLLRLLSQVAEAVFEGWFINGASSALDFVGFILEYLQKPDISSLKSVRLCSQAISGICSILYRIVLLRLSEAEGSEAVTFFRQLTYWQAVLLAAGEKQPEYLHLICYLLYVKLVTDQEDVRLAAANLWRVILVQKPSEILTMLNLASSTLQKRLIPGFQSLVGMDDESFLRWIDDQGDDLDCFFFGSLSRTWERFVREENAKTEDTARSRLAKRKDKLKQLSSTEAANEDIIRRHDVTFGHWTSNICASENLKLQRSLQDQQDDSSFLAAVFSRMYRDLRRGNGLLAGDSDTKWRLDQTEGRSRMRLRIVPDDTAENQNYQPKQKTAMSMKTESQSQSASQGVVTSTTGSTTVRAEAFEGGPADNESDDKSGLEESFEMIEDPNEDDEGFEDKNRKVMRSLHRGDQVRHVCNIARIVGLEACEGLLILGKDSLYIMDNFFQRADGEVVNVWQAPKEERDPFLGMISGREQNDQKANNNGEHDTRSWKWSELVSVSKRRFLLRDVALEIFFADGRSYLLTLMSPLARDELYDHLSSRAPQVHGSSSAGQSEDMWRFDALRNQEKTPQFFGSKLVNNVFNQSQSLPATRKWLKGEMSNFHYLMLVNTMAGRTFNDLTQYPVFPWVIADYTSDELDLNNPRTFRDLSKPMGCQTPEREAKFRERYRSFAEMGDGKAFHYGTHYSSALIVSTYLIRLQPFVKAYLSVQGASFDHADRLFYSVGKAWDSAAKSTNAADVRELTPEFYYLPEFLLNLNKYDFGLRQNGESIDSVELPPWAKGDPKIFIAKQREALESPYVTQNLHHWIDLIFGFKQRGEAAVEAVNVFHYLTYQGAKNLETIEDPMEKISDTNIIHHFGQTPHQVFNKPHPRRDEVQHRQEGLDTAAESLTLLPFPLLESEERVSSLLFSVKQDRLLCAAAFRLNIPPNYDKYMEWGFFDGSVRFYATDSRKLIGHFEHVHVGQLSCALFADSHTLITAGTDCTISVWSFSSTSKAVDLVPKASLLGHQTPVTILAVSRSFSTVLSSSKDGQIMLWDLNRHEFVRELPSRGPVDCARINDATGNILVCRDCEISLYSLNGALLLEQTVCERGDNSILSCAFYEGPINGWLQRELLFTGHRRGVVNIWNVSIQKGTFELELVKQLHHVDNTRRDGTNVSAGISCILPQTQIVYTGDENGRVYEWDCILRR